MDKKRVIKIVNKYILFLKRKKYNITNVYLFGSYAKGNYHKDSDIDLAIIIKNLSDKFDTQVELMVLRRNFDLSIEPHPIDEDDFNTYHPLAGEIKKNGIRII